MSGKNDDIVPRAAPPSMLAPGQEQMAPDDRPEIAEMKMLRTNSSFDAFLLSAIWVISG